MNIGITFNFVLVIMAISIFSLGSHQLIHATMSAESTPQSKGLTTGNDKNVNPQSKGLTTGNDKNVNPNQDPVILLPFNSNFADTKNGNEIPFP
jgi:hypothetical protein